MGEVRCEFTPGRVTLYVKVIPLCPGKTAGIGAKTDFYIWWSDPRIKRSCTFPPSYELNDHWYAGNRPGLVLVFKIDRCSQTTLSRLASGHIKLL
ncbi:hypothetical protein TNCV_962521 [Trichonephila clavipes]|nr:hypothetical protein TNCV_962521 [Trichonephila clavipes]